MRFSTTSTVLLLLLLAAGFACKEKYEPNYQTPARGYLVVEGVINANGITDITLSRTTKITQRGTQFENGADCRIDGEDGSQYQLRTAGSGHYKSDYLVLSANTRYRLRIKTAQGKEYLSKFEAIKFTPLIDTISRERSAAGLQLTLNAHDDLKKTRYYRWEYEETWEFHSLYQSWFQFNVISNSPLRVGLKPRLPSGGWDPKIFYCWKSESSSRILIGSTAKLEKDIIQEPFVFIENASWKLSVLYSLNIRQYALSREAHEFYERMKKNTEAVGTIFDPQPSQLEGNIYAVADPNEPVIGYVSVCTVVEKRIFIPNGELPGWGYRQSGCYIVDTVSTTDAYNFGLEPLDAGPPATFAPKICVDCTMRGTNVKPSFWP